MKKELYPLMLFMNVLFAGMGLSGCQNHKTEIMLDGQDTEKNTETEFDSEEIPDRVTALKEAELSEIPQEETPAEIFVDVCGAVANPGVYEMDADSRVFQVIEAAGGFLPDAASASVNQAQPVSDGQQIYVPTQEEVEEGTMPAVIQQTEAAGDSDTAEGVVNINTADADTLKSLSGIGDAKAQAILAYREEYGVFSTIEEIMQVPGIKESTFSAIKDKITVK